MKGFTTFLSSLLFLVIVGVLGAALLVHFDVIEDPLHLIKGNEIKQISLTTNNMELRKGEVIHLEANNDNGESLIYTSSNSNVVDVNEITGYVKALNSGTATITVQLKNHKDIKDECTITVIEPDNGIKVDSISLSNTKLNLTVGGSKTLYYKVSPSNASLKKITWSTSNPNVATIDKYGVVKAVGVGTTTIKVKTDNGKLATCVVSVTKKSSSTPPPTPTVKTYTLAFNPNGGSVSPVSKKIKEGETYGNLPTPTRSGYNFDGWYTSASGGNVVSSGTKISANTTIYAHWTKKTVTTYKLTYDANGGSVSPESKTLNSGAKYGDLPTPTRSGYTFNGWYTSKDGGTKVSKDTKISANTTIYAHWTKNAVTTYKLTYDANGGSVSPTSKTLNDGSSYGELPTPTRSGYKFDGWYTSKDGGSKVSKDNKITANTTIYAHWTKIDNSTKPSPDEYTISYNANGGSGSVASHVCKKDGSCTIKANGFSRNGYAFVGWTTKKDGSDDGYNWTGWSGTWKYKNGEWGIADNKLVLYARWASTAYVITEDSRFSSYSNVAACNSSTMKYRIISSGGQDYVLIWVADPANQLKLGLAKSNAQGTDSAENILKKEVSSGKCMIATNASFFSNGTPTSGVIIHDGKLIKNTGSSGGCVGIKKDGTLKECSHSTADAIVSEGYYNTWSISNSFQMPASVSGPDANRTQICQIDKNNFAMLSGSGKPGEAANKLYNFIGSKCKVVFNLDGGGSRKLYYQTAFGGITKRFGGGRKIPDVLYFIEK